LGGGDEEGGPRYETGARRNLKSVYLGTKKRKSQQRWSNQKAKLGNTEEETKSYRTL